MKERPIPFSSPMVRARMAGRKTQTRRVMKPQPLDGTPELAVHLARRGHFRWFTSGEEHKEWSCPYGVAGDRLWVREAWRTVKSLDHLPPREIPDSAPIWFEADGVAPPEFGRYRHARFMCRWMSRGLDEVVNVRVERLQDISEADAKAEGVSATPYPEHTYRGWSDGIHRMLFEQLWHRINGANSWNANPWVWVVEFKRVDQ